MKVTTTLPLVLMALGISGTASASLINEGVLTITGTVFSVPTILTVQPSGSNTTEAGCVGASGLMDVTGSCNTLSGAFTGGNEISPTQTQLVSAAHVYTVGVTSYGNLALLVNVGQPQGAAINLTQLILSIYSPSGVLQGSVAAACPTGGCVLTPSPSGVGHSGYLFQVTPDEVASLGTFNTANRVGIAASFTGAGGGAETVWLGSLAPVAAPEPASLMLLAAGLVGLAAASKMKRAQQ